MRSVALLGVLAAAGAFAPAALAQNTAPDTKASHIVAPPVAPAGLPDLAPGDEVAIACDPIRAVADPSDVRVVLTIAAAPGDSSPGYKKILALDEKVKGNAVHLKVPDAPDLPNHTVNMVVYVVDQSRSNDCDAGEYRIVATPVAPKPGG